MSQKEEEKLPSIRPIQQNRYEPPNGYISQKGLNFVNYQKDWAPKEPGKIQFNDNILADICSDANKRSLETKQRYKISSFQKYKKPKTDLDDYQSEFKNQYTLRKEQKGPAAGMDKTINPKLEPKEAIWDKVLKPGFEINKQRFGKDLGERSPEKFEYDKVKLAHQIPLKSLQIGSNQFSQGQIKF